MRPRLPAARAAAALLALAAGCAGSRAAAPRYELRFAAADAATVRDLEPMLDRGVRAVEAFFGEPFAQPFRVTVCPDRAAFDASFPPEWGVTATQPWMVATGVADDLRILSPRVWAREAGGHDAGDRAHVQGIVTHELVHVFHGQHNPTRDFTGCDEIGWFLEGLAVLASGQLAAGHADRAAAALAAGAAPQRLATAWSGPYRYGVCGSLVEFVDRTLGRAALVRMLRCTTQDELLAVLGMTEDELLRRWAAAVPR